jgi:uncharacterized small protein (DUF1192 family)
VVAPAQVRNDPNVKIPTAIKNLAAAADAAFHAANGTTPAPIEPVAPVAPVVVAPEVTLEVTPPVVAAPPQDWEHAFKSMKGRYESSQNNIRAMGEQMTAMQSEVARLQASTVATPNELQAASLLTPEETNEYGAEFLSVVGKKALEQLSPEMAALKKEIAELKGQRAGDTAAQSVNARNAMNTDLDNRLPTWRTVNVAPEFHSWLQLPDPFSGAIRHSLLSAAYEQNNTPRVLAFFNGFLAHEAALAPAPVGGVPDTTEDNSGKIPLEAFAAPGRAKTSAAPGAPVEKPTFTAAQISKFYADSSSGKYRGRDAEYARIDAQIIEAGREGRIR